MRSRPPLRGGEAIDGDPIARFASWFEEAAAAGLPEPTMMSLATATSDGRPSVRTVLLKGFDARGFVFATNYESRKALELESNPWAALALTWIELQRQVRIEGPVQRTSAEESDAVHRARPRQSQISAWASAQSRELPDASALERELERYDRLFPAQVPRPPHWGAYRVAPRRIEFWAGKPHRLHERVLFTLDETGAWRAALLAP